MTYSPVIQGASIAAIGAINPAIFSPAWLHLNGVISAEEMNAATVAIVHPEVTEFSIDTISFDIQQRRFFVSTTEEPFVRIADMVSIIFGKLLTHTPIEKLGINYDIHFNLDNPNQRHELGRALAPTGPWGEWGKAIEAGGLERPGGLRSVSIEESRPDGREAGYRRVRLEPSVRSELDPMTGMYMSVNDHYELGAGLDGAEKLVVCLAENFDASIEKSKDIVAKMMDFAAGLK